MRGGIDFKGIRTYGEGVTYFADEDLMTAAGTDNRKTVIGKAVTLVADSTVGFGTDGDALLGVIKQYEYDGVVTVDDVGYVVVPGTANVGDVVVVDGNGGVKADATAKYGPTVVSVDAANGTVVVKL